MTYVKASIFQKNILRNTTDLMLHSKFFEDNQLRVIANRHSNFAETLKSNVGINILEYVYVVVSLFH